MKPETVVAPAADQGWLQPTEIARVRAQFDRLVPQSDSFAAAFYQRLFQLAPSVRTMFPVDLAEQQSKLVHMLAMLVARLDAPAQLAVPLTRLGEQHHRYGVTRKDFALVGVALLDALAEHLADDFDASARHAWRRLYMQAAATVPAAPHAMPEDLGWRAPDWFIQGVSGGMGPIGVAKGFEELIQLRLADKVPSGTRAGKEWIKRWS